jgi:hypothetical protein
MATTLINVVWSTTASECPVAFKAESGAWRVQIICAIGTRLGEVQVQVQVQVQARIQ